MPSCKHRSQKRTVIDMAKVVKSLPMGPGKQGVRKYPWERYFDGQIWEFHPKTDFSCRPESFLNSAKYAAGRKGLKIVAAKRGQACYIQAKR